MLLSDWRVLTRRWYIILGGLLLTLIICWLGARLVPAQYQLSSSFLLLPPKTVVDGRPTNPYLNLGGLEGVSDVMSTALEDNSIGDSLSAAGLDAEYEVSRDFSVAGPVLLLDVRGASPRDALQTQTYLLSRVPVVLSGLQQGAGVSPSSRITSTVITKDEQPKVNRKSQVRLLLVAGFGGIAATYLSATVIDGVLMSRRRVPVGAARPLEPLSGRSGPEGGRFWRP